MARDRERAGREPAGLVEPQADREACGSWSKRESHRRVRLREARRERARHVARSRRAHAVPPGVLRPDRPAADGGRDRRLCRRSRGRQVRAARRSPARLAALRRALGAALARCRALRRHARLRQGQAARPRVAVPRLCDPRAQRRQAVRAIRRGAARRRRALSEHARRSRGARFHRGGTVGFHRPRGGQRGQDRRQVRAALRPRRHGGQRDRHLRERDGAVRAVPQPQVRSGDAGRLLRAAGGVRGGRPRGQGVRRGSRDRRAARRAHRGTREGDGGACAHRQRVREVRGRRTPRTRPRDRRGEQADGRERARVRLPQRDRARRARREEMGAGRPRSLGRARRDRACAVPRRLQRDRRWVRLSARVPHRGER